MINFFTMHVPCPELSPHVEECGWGCSRTFYFGMGHPDMFIIHDLRNYPVMLNIPNVFAEFAAGPWPQGWALARISILRHPQE